MKKYYPYLQDPYNSNLNDVTNKNNYLARINDYVNQKQHIKITLLNWNEDPIKEIAGEVSSGSITKDGTSSVRRTASLQVNVDGESYSPEDADMDFAINKKVFIELGIENRTDQYPEYPVLWFPQGVFFIKSFSISSAATSSVSLSLSLRDKMSMLNGDVGGTLPATTIFDTVDTQLPSGEYRSQKVKIYDIIEEAVNHFGGEDLNRIVIEDIPLKIKRVMRWVGDMPLHLIRTGSSDDSSATSYIADVEEPQSDVVNVEKYTNGSDVGYVYDDFVYTSELELAAGDTVTTLLDKIIQYLGNYEYYYDEYGIFHFKEIKNYMNTTLATTAINSMTKDDYSCETTISKNSYTFNSNSNIISLSCTPQYESIKNDYVVQGLRKSTVSDTSYAVRYHLAIDSKPRRSYLAGEDKQGNAVYTYEPRKDFILYREADTDLVKGGFLYRVENLPDVGNFNVLYACGTDYVYWDALKNSYQNIDVVKAYVGDEAYTPQDWRTEIYVQGLAAKNLGRDKGSYWGYFAELESGWPAIYDLEKQQFYAEEEEDLTSAMLTDGNFFLDFIDPTSTRLGKYAVKAIGRRSDIVVDDEINCLFQPRIPEVVYINMDDEDANEQVIEMSNKGQPFSQVRSSIYNNLATGGYKNGAFDRIKYELYLHTNYQRSLSITAMPIYYLEPNTRVEVAETTTNTYGDFIIKTVSIPFGPSGSMTVSASETFERF